MEIDGLKITIAINKDASASLTQRPLKRLKKTFKANPSKELGLEESQLEMMEKYVFDQPDLVSDHPSSHHHLSISMVNVLYQ